MKTALTSILATAVLAAPAIAEPHRYELDPEHTTIAFLVDHLGFADTLGLFTRIEGGFTYDMETKTLSDVEVRVETESVETFNDARDGHLRGTDFLDVASHPLMVFTAEGGTPASDTAGTVAGELTLLGQTRPLTLEVTLNQAARYPFGHQRFVLGLSARATVVRSDYGMTYAVDNGFVGDDIEVIIETEAMRVE
ncbi:MAG: YceI family protein [Roseibium sp.]|nr:YceI family protein [Roseibium sp.]